MRFFLPLLGALLLVIGFAPVAEAARRRGRWIRRLTVFKQPVQVVRRQVPC